MMGIEDIHDDWDHAQNLINIALAKKAQEIGITRGIMEKNKYFKEFNILDTYKTVKTCD